MSLIELMSQGQTEISLKDMQNSCLKSKCLNVLLLV